MNNILETKLFVDSADREQIADAIKQHLLSLSDLVALKRNDLIDLWKEISKTEAVVVYRKYDHER